jgi:hypothetical protein
MADQMGVYAALAAAQGKFPAIPKTHTATVSSEKDGKWTKYSYNYADLSDIISAIRPVLAEHSLAVTQPIELLDSGGLALRTSVMHSDGSAIHSMLPLPAPAGKPQAFGSALTYMRRYALSSLLGIASEEDDDGSAAEQPGDVQRTSRQPQRPPERQQAPPPRRVDNTGLSPAQAVDKALSATVTPLTLPPGDSDPWKLGPIPAQDVCDTIIAAIGRMSWSDSRLILKRYLAAGLKLTENEDKLIGTALSKRREDERQDALLAVG